MRTSLHDAAQQERLRLFAAMLHGVMVLAARVPPDRGDSSSRAAAASAAARAVGRLRTTRSLRMQRRRDTLDLWECALGFMDAQVLLTAHQCGVFDVLAARPHALAEVASAIELPLDSTERLLIALCALGIIRRREDGTYENGPEADAQLVRGRPGYIGAMFDHVREHLYPTWRYLGQALREQRPQWELAFGGRPAPSETMFSDPAALRAFMEGMHGITHAAAHEFATRAPELGEIEYVVDVGGASGAFLIALAERFPALRGLVFDLPPVRPIAEDFIRQSALEHRLRFASGDFWEDPIPDGGDAYALGFILHDWDDLGCEILLDGLSGACPAGGLLIIGEYLLDDDRTGPRHVARQHINMLVAARGRERSAREYQDFIERFGFRLERVTPTQGGKHFLTARRM